MNPSSDWNQNPLFLQRGLKVKSKEELKERREEKGRKRKRQKRTERWLEKRMRGKYEKKGKQDMVELEGLLGEGKKGEKEKKQKENHTMETTLLVSGRRQGSQRKRWDEIADGDGKTLQGLRAVSPRIANARPRTALPIVPGASKDGEINAQISTLSKYQNTHPN